MLIKGTRYFDAYYELEGDLSPSDFLYIENEDELRFEIICALEEKIDMGDVIWMELFEDEIEIPEEFYIEWRKLKGYETNSI